jgi:aerobic carbon-monoxide dehydrogenase medium subunit
MFPANFNYVRPKSLAEAVRFLNDHPEDAKVLAGGQSLIPMLKLRLAMLEYLVDIGRLAELKRIEEAGDSLRIGGLVRHTDIESSALIARTCPLLAETAGEIGDVQVRNRGTIGGSLAHGDPAADFPAAILALEARLSITGPNGQRTIAAQDFFTDLMTTALQPNEILTSIEVSKLAPHTGSAYAKMHQQASGFAIVGVASIVALDGAGKVSYVRIGVTGVTPVPYRALRAEEMLLGKTPDANAIAEASAHVAQNPRADDALADIHASAHYRREMANVYAQRSLKKAVERASAK